MEFIFDSRDQASVTAAEHIAEALADKLQQASAASMVVTGGSSPAACYEALATAELEWDRVDIWPSDERWLPVSHEDSNERMIRNTLLTDHAVAARFRGLYDETTDVDSHCAIVSDAIHQFGRPFACTLLGVGEDGHIASLFPDAENLADGLDVDNQQYCLAIKTAASPHRRVSLTLSALLHSKEIVLLFFGDVKRAVYEEAKCSATAYPVSRLLHQEDVPVTVFWAP